MQVAEVYKSLPIFGTHPHVSVRIHASEIPCIFSCNIYENMRVAEFYKSLPIASDMTYEKVGSDT